MKRRLIYWFYLRRARRLETVAQLLGWDAVIEYGERRGWIDHIDPRGRIHLRRGRL